MSKYIKRAFPFFIMLGILFGIWNIYAYFEDSVTVTNHIKTGDVNIGISEYEMKNGREVPYENAKQVFPGDILSKIPRITNYAEPCWVRAKVEFGNSIAEQEGLSMENIKGMSEKWLLRGDYYYYNEALDYHETADLFRTVTIPVTWSEDHNAQKLSIKIQAEAIQAANFEPDFSAMSPWGNEEIELCVHEENGISACIKEEMTLQVEFNGQAHKLLAVPNNFFHNIKRAMPGDVYQDEILLSNTTKKAAELFFRTEVVNQTEAQKDLLQKILLRIFMDQKVLYEGNLSAEKLKENISLGIYEPDEAGKLEFEISIPKELNNAYALRDADVNWIFSVCEEEEISEPTEDSSETQKTSVKTGDTSPIAFSIMLLGIAGGSLVIGIYLKKKVKKHEE